MVEVDGVDGWGETQRDLVWCLGGGGSSSGGSGWS